MFSSVSKDLSRRALQHHAGLREDEDAKAHSDKATTGGWMKASTAGCDTVDGSLGGGNSNILYVHPYLGKILILTVRIFFNWVVRPPPSSETQR